MKNNVEKSRYELEMDGHIAYADYSITGDTLNIKYVYAPPELRGTGAAGKLMQDIMDQVKKENWKVNPICGYAATWIRRHS